MKLHRMLFVVVMLGTGILSQAQQATPAATASGPTSTINWFWAICDTKAVVDLDGTMESGDDVYVQFFREAGATGAPLSNLIRVNANGAFRTSVEATYPAGTLLALGQFGSMRISIASESDPTKASFTRVLDDVYDTCITPANPVGTISSVGGTGTSGQGSFVDPITGQAVSPIAGRPIRSSGILKPGGGYLNEVYAIPAEQPVQIGARPSANNRVQGRTSNPGLIFAECNQFPGADPGRVFDTDGMTVYWSWFAKTAAQVRDHQAKAQYLVQFEAAGLPTQTFPNVQVSPIVKREDGNFYVFYTVNIGSAYRPGLYRVNYQVTWSGPTSDGYKEFGPGTETESLSGNCIWNVEQNPFGTPVSYENPRLFAQ